MEIKVGDLVKFRSDLEVGRYYEGLEYMEALKAHVNALPNRIGKIKNTFDTPKGAYFQIEGLNYYFTPIMVEEIVDTPIEDEIKSPILTASELRNRDQEQVKLDYIKCLIEEINELLIKSLHQ